MTKDKTNEVSTTDFAINYNGLGAVTNLMKDAQNIRNLTNSIFGRCWNDTQSSQLQAVCEATNTSISMLQEDITSLQALLAPYENTTNNKK